MFNPNEVKRMLKRMGINVNVKDVNASRVIIELKDGGSLELSDPTVVLLELPGGVLLYQVQVDKRGVKVNQPQVTPKIVIKAQEPKYSEDDVRLVMDQTGVSREEAIKALEEANGDLAEAILRIQRSKGQA
jgi:nascent polypeptide-associated complex subunit alpha